MSTTHRHVSQPTRKTAEWNATMEQRRLSPTSWRCSWEPGDPCTIVESCRCHATRRTPAVWDGVKAVPTAPVGAWT